MDSFKYVARVLWVFAGGIAPIADVSVGDGSHQADAASPSPPAGWVAGALGHPMSSSRAPPWAARAILLFPHPQDLVRAPSFAKGVY